jgi:hypothetical protein
MNKKIIYIASPYSNGNPAKNVKRQIDAYNLLDELGYLPFAPLLNHFVDLNSEKERSWQDWIDICLDWVRKSDGLLRLSGDSLGADKEVEEAIKNKIPVFHSLDQIEAWDNEDLYCEHDESNYIKSDTGTYCSKCGAFIDEMTKQIFIKVSDNKLTEYGKYLKYSK